MKRLLTDTIPQTILINEMLTPLKRCHQPMMPQTMLNQNLPCYQNILREKDSDYSTVNGLGGDIFQSEMVDEPQMPSHTMPFKSLHSFKFQDSFILGRMTMTHRNSFDELAGLAEKNVKIEGADSSAATGFKSSMRSNFFECLNNLEQEEGFCSLSNTNNQCDNFMEDLCNNNNNSSLGGLDEMGHDDQANMTDLYWQAASTVAAMTLQNANLHQAQLRTSGVTDSCGLPEYFQDNTDYNNQTQAYQDNQSEQTNNNINAEGQLKGTKRRERKNKNSSNGSSSSLIKLKRQSSNSTTQSVYKKNKTLENLDENTAASDEKRGSLFKQQSNLIKRKSHHQTIHTASHTPSISVTPLQEETTENTTPRASSSKAFIGPLTISERLEKVRKYLQKKGMKSQMKKFCYKCRKQVAEKRLRIKGRFVTKEQAFEILGITSDELKSNEIIQKLLENHANNLGGSFPMVQLNSLVESQDGNKQIKIRNFQALIDDNYNHNSNHQGNIFFTKYNSFASTATNNGSTLLTSSPSIESSEIKDTQSLTPTSSKLDPTEEVARQLQLNLRISTLQEGTGNHHVSKVMIQNYSSLTGDGSMSQQIEETLKLSLSNLRLEGYVQPLFRVEKILKKPQDF